jgi:hypothetical protein
MGCRIASAGRLGALIATIRNSPIVVRLRTGFLPASEWARIRKSPQVDAFVLAWIASHVRDPRRRPRHFM